MCSSDLVGLGWILPVPAAWHTAAPWFNGGLVILAAAALHAFRLSFALGAGVLLLVALGYAGLALLEAADVLPVWKCVTLGLAGALSLQFLGHQLAAAIHRRAVQAWRLDLNDAA